MMRLHRSFTSPRHPAAMCRVFLPSCSWPSSPRPAPRALAAPEPVARVVDGDTVRMMDGEPVRLMGLDAPERRARCPAEARRADQATARLVQLAAGGLELRRRGRDRYGRTLAVASTPAGQDVAAILIGEGLAVPYRGRGPRMDWCRPGL